MDVDTGENIVDNVDINITDNGAFDNLTIRKELSNIVNVSDEDFLNSLPVPKKLRRRKWILMFDLLKQSIYEGMIQDMNGLWSDENMPQKLDILERQIEKFKDTVNSHQSWRPQLGDVAAQLKSHDLVALNKQKKSLNTMVTECECQIENHMAALNSRRSYIKVLQFDMQRYRNKKEVLLQNYMSRLDNKHNEVIVEQIKFLLHNLKWSDEDLEIEEEN